MTDDPRRPSDEQLAADAQDGSLEAFSELITRYQARVYHFIRHKTVNDHDAEDVTQQVFITAWRRIDRFDVRARFATWLFTITRRLTINYYRARGRHTSVELESAESQLVNSTTPASDLAARDEHAALWQTARQCLSENQFNILWLKYREQMAIADIARALGKSSVAVKVQLHRARKTLGAALRGAGANQRADQLPRAESPNPWHREMTLLVESV